MVKKKTIIINKYYKIIIKKLKEEVGEFNKVKCTKFLENKNKKHFDVNELAISPGRPSAQAGWVPQSVGGAHTV